MKASISIPDDVFKATERFARQRKMTRSRLYCDALKEYLARHSPDTITEALNAACDEIGDTKDSFMSAAVRRILEKSEW
jgi:predicted transcriptional regulator